MIGFTKKWFLKGSITLTSLQKHRLHLEEHECIDAGGLIRNGGPIMIYLLFKSINPSTSIGLSNLKYEIDNTILAKFDNSTKYLLDGISSNYNIIIDKG